MKKYLVIPIPIIVMWIVFGIGHLLNFGAKVWWSIPYGFTSLGALIFSIVGTISLYEKFEREETGRQ